jgi:hypothetical protein
VVVVSSASVLLLLLMLFGFVSRESAIMHKRESVTQERSKKKGVCACVFFLCILFVYVVRWEFCCWCVAVFVVEFCGACVCFVFYADFWGGMVLGGSWRMVCQPAPYRRHQKIITSSKMV